MMPTDDEIDERNVIRDESALAAAKSIIEDGGLSALTREAIAERANLAVGSISNFGRTRISNGDHNSDGYRVRILRELMRRAVETHDARMISIGLADGCLKADALPEAIRERLGV